MRTAVPTAKQSDTCLPSLTSKGPLVNIVECMLPAPFVGTLVFLRTAWIVLFQFPAAHAAIEWLDWGKLVELLTSARGQSLVSFRLTSPVTTNCIPPKAPGPYFSPLDSFKIMLRRSNWRFSIMLISSMTRTSVSSNFLKLFSPREFSINFFIGIFMLSGVQPAKFHVV